MKIIDKIFYYCLTISGCFIFNIHYTLLNLQTPLDSFNQILLQDG